jgi:succinate dehydrogenase / fumarate reductase membrane anchor subunit
MVKGEPNLGSAKHGTTHWWHQRVTALALIIILLCLMSSFITKVVFGNGFEDAEDFLRSPFAATMVILLLIAGFYHTVLGLQVIIEDYVHCEALKLASILGVKFAGFALAVLGIVSTIKVLFWSLIDNAVPPQ